MFKSFCIWLASKFEFIAAYFSRDADFSADEKASFICAHSENSRFLNSIDNNILLDIMRSSSKAMVKMLSAFPLLLHHIDDISDFCNIILGHHDSDTSENKENFKTFIKEANFENPGALYDSLLFLYHFAEIFLITLKDYFSPDFRWAYIVSQFSINPKWCGKFLSDNKDTIGLVDLVLQVCTDGNFKALPSNHPIYNLFTEEEKSSIANKQQKAAEGLEALQMEHQALLFLKSKTDIYTELNVDPDAKEDEIAKGYRKATLSCHPDRHPDKAEEFNRLKAMYQTILNHAARTTYNEYYCIVNPSKADKMSNKDTSDLQKQSDTVNKALEASIRSLRITHH